MTEIVAVLIAACAMMIAFGQFYNTRRANALTLFEKRMAIYRTFRQGMLCRCSGQLYPEGAEEFQKALLEGQFLFGRDVEELLEEVLNIVATLNMAEDRLSKPNRVGESESLAQQIADLQQKLADADLRFHKLLQLYMRMDQKLHWEVVRRALRWWGIARRKDTELADASASRRSACV